MQTSVVIVNPGGTGNPIRAISARFAPLPPSNSLCFASPSVFLPKSYTYLMSLALDAFEAVAFFAGFDLADLVFFFWAISKCRV